MGKMYNLQPVVGVTLVDSSGNAITSANPAQTQPIIGGAPVSPTNGLPMMDAYQAPVTTTWNSGTAANATLTVNTAGYDVVMVSLVNSGSVTGGHVTAEVFDGAAWLPIKIFAMESYNSFQGVALSGPLNNGWQCDLAGFSQFRVRLDTQITGSGSTLLTLGVTSAPSVPGVTAGLDPAAHALDANGLVVQSGISSTFWNYASVGNGIVNSSAAVQIAAATDTTHRNYLKTLTLAHDALGAVSEISIRSGVGNILWRGKLQTAAVDSAQASVIYFDPPIKGALNTSMEVIMSSAVSGGVYVNATGFTGI